uniref:N5-carboxyaminoimidazole ribonucleotide mutase n=1 Tax=Thermodesulfobacterium geofontis TaxID=1295609 RepID=A0A7C4NTD4_9BACT
MKVGILMGSDSDLPIMKESAEILEFFEIPYEISIISAHRTPEKALEYAKTAEERGIEVIIAGAGGAAHLPGVIASLTLIPVIGVPIKSNFLDGLDSLLSIVQMPAGIPVATVAINNAKNAALLAVHILSIKYPELKEKLKKYREEIKNKVIEKNEKLQNLGYKNYLSSS